MRAATNLLLNLNHISSLFGAETVSLTLANRKQLSLEMTYTAPSISRDDFPYFETHIFDGRARQFRTMVASVDNDCFIAFDPMTKPPTDEEGSLFPQTPAQVRALSILQDRRKLANRELKTHLARATRGNPAEKRLFEKQNWKNARNFYSTIVDQYQLRKKAIVLPL